MSMIVVEFGMLEKPTKIYFQVVRGGHGDMLN